MQDKKTRYTKRRQDIAKEQEKRKEKRETRQQIFSILKTGQDKKDKSKDKIGHEIFLKIFCVTVQFF